MRVVIVTGTDTDVGKTIVTAALAAGTAASGPAVHAYKPAQTGVVGDEPGDSAVVSHLSGVPCSEGVRLRDPLAPDVAARREGVTLPGLAEQRDRILALPGEVVLVEGAGGILVRVGADWDLLDLGDALRPSCPVEFIVVARAGLGTLNHTTLTVRAIQQRKHTVRGVVIGSAPAAPDLAEQQNLGDLPAMTGVPVLGAIPAGAGSWTPAAFAAGAAHWLAPLPR